MLYEVITGTEGPKAEAAVGLPVQVDFPRVWREQAEKQVEQGAFAAAAGAGDQGVHRFIAQEREQPDRITSYNVCYTKLLRSAASRRGFGKTSGLSG